MSKTLKDLETPRELDNEVIIPTEYTFQRKLGGIKASIVIAFIFSFLALCAAVYLYQNLIIEKTERVSLEARQVALQSSADSLDDKVEQYQSIIDQLKGQVETYVSERKDFRREFERSQVEISNLEKKLRAMEDRNKEMKTELQSLAQAQTSQPAVVADNSYDNSSLDYAQPAAPRVTDDAPSYNASRTVYESSPQTAAAQPVSSEAKVLTLNRQFNFVVVNLGTRDGIRLGDEMSIYSGRKMVGSVQVEKLYDKFSAATIIDEMNGGIGEGDNVRQ